MASWVLSPGASVTGTRSDKAGFLFWGRPSVAQVKSQRFWVRSSLDSLETKGSDMRTNGNSVLLYLVLWNIWFLCLFCFLGIWYFVFWWENFWLWLMGWVTFHWIWGCLWWFICEFDSYFELSLRIGFGWRGKVGKGVRRVYYVWFEFCCWGNAMWWGFVVVNLNWMFKWKNENLFAK